MTWCELYWHPVHSYAKNGELLYDRNLARSWCRSQRQQAWVLIWEDQQGVNFPRSRWWFRIAYLSSWSGFQEPISALCTQKNISEKKCWQISLCNPGGGIYTTFSPFLWFHQIRLRVGFPYLCFGNVSNNYVPPIYSPSVLPGYHVFICAFIKTRNILSPSLF